MKCESRTRKIGVNWEEVFNWMTVLSKHRLCHCHFQVKKQILYERRICVFLLFSVSHAAARHTKNNTKAIWFQICHLYVVYVLVHVYNFDTGNCNRPKICSDFEYFGWSNLLLIVKHSGQCECGENLAHNGVTEVLARKLNGKLEVPVPPEGCFIYNICAPNNSYETPAMWSGVFSFVLSRQWLKFMCETFLFVWK